MQRFLKWRGVQHRVTVAPHRNGAVGNEDAFHLGEKLLGLEPMECLGGRDEIYRSRRQPARIRLSHPVFDLRMQRRVLYLLGARVSGDHFVEARG